MYGLIAKIVMTPGKREEMVGLLRESAADMPGCLSYLVACDAADDNVVWVTEVWESEVAHEASLALPAVHRAIPKAKALVSNFVKVAVTNPVCELGFGLRTSREL